MGQFLASLYNYIYILVVAIITLYYLPKYVYVKNQGISHNEQNNNNAYLLLVFVIVFIGLRPISGKYFFDMSAYDRILTLYEYEHFEFDWDTDNKIFDNFILWFATRHLDHRIFFLLMAALYFGAMYFGLKRLFPQSAKLAFLTYLAGFSTFSYSVNGIKAGVAASIFILALSYSDKKLVCALLMLISLGFHHSMILPIVTCLLAFYIKNPKLYYLIWIFCLLMCIFRVKYFQEVFAGMSDEQGAIYLTATEKTTSAHMGFRPDFILYSAVPVIMGYYFELGGRYKLSRKFQFLIHFYILTNAIWMLCMYASFNNRIAYLSWFVYPIVIIAPFLDKFNNDSRRYLKLDQAVKYHLFFTMFMVFIYYGLLNFGR